MTAQLAPPPVFRATDNNGFPLFLGQLSTFAAGTTTPQATYVDSTQTTPNTNPVILNFRGECNLWLDPAKAYKLILKDAFGNLIWTIDNVTIGNANPSFSIIPTVDNLFTLGNTSFSWANVFVGPNHATVLDTVSGNIGYYARTTAELAAGIVPSNFSYPPGHVYRYGTNTTPGTTDMAAAIRSAFSIPNVQVILPGDVMLVNSNLGIPLCGSVVGYGWNDSIITCGPAVTKCISITQVGGPVPATVYKGFRINGNSTASAWGMGLGDGSLTSQITIKDVLINGFTGTNAAGMKLDQIVTVHCFNVIIQGCTTDLITGSTPGLPTTCHFWGGWLQTSLGYGAGIFSGSQICFHGTVIENNTQGGINAVVAAGCTIVDLQTDEQTHFEGNWVGHVDTGTKVFDVVLDGTNGVCNAIVEDTSFSHGTSSAHDMRSMGLTHAIAALNNVHTQFGFPFEFVLFTSDCAIQCLGDIFGLQDRQISNPTGASVTAPLFKPVIDLGSGLSAAPIINVIGGITYSASMTPDCSLADAFNIQVTNVTAFTINAPLHSIAGNRITIKIQNVSGNNVLGVLTWNAVFKLAAWVQPANNLEHNITFGYDGANWREYARTVTAIPV